MDQPLWIAEASVEQIHALQLAEHGGLAGVRDQSLLQSALHRPLNLWHYARASADMAALAAAYAAGIARITRSLMETRGRQPSYASCSSISTAGWLQPMTTRGLTRWLRSPPA